MAGKKAPAKPEVVEVNLRGKRGIDIAQMIDNGEVDQEYAERFVAERAVGKLHKAMGLDSE